MKLTLTHSGPALRAALQWRLLLLWTGALLIPTTIVALPAWQVLRANLDYSVHASALARQLDMTALADLMSVHGQSSTAFTNIGIMALIATLLMSPLLSGMALAAWRAQRVQQTLRFGGLLRGGLDTYPRMLRTLLWAALPLGIALLLGEVATDAAAMHGASAVTAADASLATWAASAVAALLFVLAHASVDAGRAALMADATRRSALKAWWAGCLLLMRRPFATLGTYLLITGAGLGLAALLAIARVNLPGENLALFLVALMLTQLIVAVIGWMRIARLFALADLCAALAPAQTAMSGEAVR